MGKTRNTGYLQNIIQYDGSNNIILPALVGTGTRMVVAAANGTLSYQDIPTVSNIGGVPTTRTITINGTSQDLSANRTWTLYTDDISEDGSPVNLWFTNARARAAISVSGSLSYDSATGVISYTTPSTTGITEGSNLYYTDARVGTYLTNNSYATQNYVSTAISNLVNSAPATLDTLNELATALGNDPNFATTISTALGNRLRVDINTQGLTSTQKGYGRTNLGVVIGTDVQAYDADLDAIAALSGTSGFLKKTAANTWTLDTNTYVTGGPYLPLTGGTLTGALSGTSATFSGNVRKTGAAGVYTELQSDGVYATGTDLYLLAPSTKGVYIYTNNTQALSISSTGAATFSSSVTAGGAITTSAGLNSTKNIVAGEFTPLHLSYSSSDGSGPAARFGSSQGFWDIQPSSNNQRISFEWSDSVNTLSLFSDGRVGINDTDASRKLAVNFGTSVNDGLIVYGSQRQNTIFRSTGEHCFLYIDSHHANIFLPKLHLQRSSTTYGLFGLERASNSDSIGAYTESEVIVGSTTTVPFSLQTNNTRRINIESGGNVNIYNALTVNGNLFARNFCNAIKTWYPAGSTGSFTSVTYNWADELAALSGYFNTGCLYKGFLRSANGAHYHGYHFDILVGAIGYGGNSLQFKIQNLVEANSAWAGGCGGTPFGTVDTTNFTHRNNPCGESLTLYITRLG